jgi:arylsulfatase A-like enzyme
MLAEMPANLRKYAAGLAAADRDAGALIAKVHEKGLSDNTLIILLSGNGYLLGHHGLWGDSTASQPGNMHEEVVRVPMIWSWPLRFPPQTVRNEVTSASELLPSICELAGAPAPVGRPAAARSYLTFVYGRRLPKKQTWPGVVFARAGNVEMAREERYKLVVRDQGKGPNELYDEVADGRETTNQYDNAQFVTVRDSLAAALTAWRGKKS